MPKMISMSTGRTSANSASAWPSSRVTSLRVWWNTVVAWERRPRGRREKKGGSRPGAGILPAPGQLPAGSDGAGDAVEDVADVAAEQRQRRDGHDGHQRQDQRVLDEGLALLAVTNRREQVDDRR